MANEPITPPEAPKTEQPPAATVEATRKALEEAKNKVGILAEAKKKLQELMTKLNTMKPEEKAVAAAGLFVPILLKWILDKKPEEEEKTKEAEATPVAQEEKPKKKKSKNKKKPKQKTDETEPEEEVESEEEEEKEEEKPKKLPNIPKPKGTRTMKDNEVSDSVKEAAKKFQSENKNKPYGTKKEVEIDGRTYVFQIEPHTNRNPNGAPGTTAYVKV